jgi:hypothetical protein
MKRTAGWSILLVLPILACSLSQFGWKGESPKTEKEAETSAFREDFDPLTLPEEDVKVVSRGGAAARQPVVKPIVIPKTERSQASGETVQGFRVQLIATTDENHARDVKKNAMLRLKNKVYLIFEAPHYKIRVGDCTSREEAKSILEDAVTNGFPDAWIVPSTVYKNGSGQSEE